MPWTERQHALLRAMGHHLWQPALAEDADADVAVDVATAAGDAIDAEDGAGRPLSSAKAEGAVVRATPGVAATADAALPEHAPQATRHVAAPIALTAALEADPSPIATLDWPALRATVAACRACPLCTSRTQTVFGVGHPQAHWMVVGEAPGEQEDLQGEPFVGAAGQLLDRMLAALQLTRAADGPQPLSQRAYIVNALKCRPPRNRNPTPAETAQCTPYLMRQIELLQPRLILALGRFAVQALLKSDEPIGKLRGRVHRWQGTPVIVSYHPSYLLRSPLEKARAWEDLCLAAATMEQIVPPQS